MQPVLDLIPQSCPFKTFLDNFIQARFIFQSMIIIINIVGGLIVGVVQHDLPIGEAATTYTLLTIGDGLVAQIPALIISTAAGIVVSRVGTDKDLSEMLLGQLFTSPRVLNITAGVIGLIGIIPNMPHLAFLFIAGLLAGLGRLMSQRAHQEQLEAQKAETATRIAREQPVAEVSWNDVQHDGIHRHASARQ